MSTAFSARLKLTNVLKQIKHLLAAETPFENVPLALRQLEHVMQLFEARLEKAIKLNDKKLIDATAENINQKILSILPILGFIVRSTNVRNAFELLEPLNTIATSLLGSKAKLMISSEWDYIPFAYPIGIDDLRSFIFIGLPSSEAANLLIVPLAGHEMGHAVWRIEDVSGAIGTTLEYHVSTLFDNNIAKYKSYNPRYNGDDDLLSKQEKNDSIEMALEYALSQAEEYFCDFVGLVIFGQSYLRAFAYILAPGMGGRRSSRYPNQLNRADALVKCAKELGVPVSDQFTSQFNGNDAVGLKSFELDIAEQAVKVIMPSIWRSALEVIEKAGMPRTSISTSRQIERRFELGDMRDAA
jgi:hypothetical protein